MTNSSPRLLIKNGTVIDGSGRDPVRNSLVVVEGNRIGHAGRGDGSLRPESPDDTVIDPGQYQRQCLAAEPRRRDRRHRPGKLADIVIWDRDPLADITVLQRLKEISLIIKLKTAKSSIAGLAVSSR